VSRLYNNLDNNQLLYIAIRISNFDLSLTENTFIKRRIHFEDDNYVGPTVSAEKI